MTGAKKIATIHAQMKEVRSGKRKVMDCPYCGQKNEEPSILSESDPPICCDTFGQAVAAILHREYMQKTQDHAARVAEMASRN